MSEWPSVALALLPIIKSRNQTLDDRLASAETMGVADVALYEDVLEQKQLIVDILKTLAGVTTKPDETNLDHRLGETCFRAHMHCGVQPIDYGAVEHHVRHALELLETR